MILKDITNLHKNSSMLDLRKLPACDPSPSTELFSCYFPSIFNTSFNAAKQIHYDYSDNLDPSFIVRNLQVEWMFSVQILLKLADDTIFESILILDKFLSLRKVPLHRMGLLAAVCVILSSKSNEIYPVRLNKINVISKVCYSLDEFAELEMEVLKELQFQLPHGTVFELFKLYQFMFKLEGVLKKDSVMWILHRCVFDLELLRAGAKAASLASICYLCRLKRVLVNMGAAADNCRQYPKALSRISQMVKDMKSTRQTHNPESSRYIDI